MVNDPAEIVCTDTTPAEVSELGGLFMNVNGYDPLKFIDWFTESPYINVLGLLLDI